jgi:RNA polymerase sporulation-specific sigma factor
VALRTAVETLPEKEKKVIALRFYHGLTQSDCARILRISQVQVSRLERRAVEALRLVMQ